MTDIHSGGEYLRRLDSELFEFGYNNVPPLRVEDYEVAYDIDPEDSILSTLALCNSVISHGYIVPRSDEPVFELTERTIEHALHHHRIEPSKNHVLSEVACLQAEPRLLRSLSWHDGPQAERLGGRNNVKPAAIFFDNDGEPFAYQKASGHGTAYVWRPCTIDTEGARYRLPADCFIAIEYPPADDPRFLYLGRSLIAFEKIPQQATIDLLRFSTLSLNKALRLEGAHTAIERDEKLAEQLPELAEATSNTIGTRVEQLLKDDRALRVSRHY